MGNFFSDLESESIVRAISDIEKNTISEIRIHIEDHCEEPSYDRAVQVFNELGMYNTVKRTGILIYLATIDRKLAILGDVGIHEKLEHGYWEKIMGEMSHKFQSEGIYMGILHGIQRVGEQLIIYFPEKGTPTNELSNEISYGKG